MKHLLALAPVLLLFPLAAGSSDSQVFTPAHRLSGVGVDRETITEAVLAKRTELMIESQTFGILRDARAVTGAQRILSPRLQKIFSAASASSGFPASTLAAVAYLESWGEPDAQSPAGPRGIMQASEGTAKAMGMRIVRVTRYKVTTEKVLVKKRRGKAAFRTVKHKTPYTEMVLDERLVPERAIPAAARYLARMEQKFGGRDWAIFAYHCGEGCVSEFKELAHDANLGNDASVAKVFFAAHPSLHHKIYQAIQHHMERDYSPTYYFRVMRAEQLLALYQKDPQEFKSLADSYELPNTRPVHRLSVWIRDKDLALRTADDLKTERGKQLIRLKDNPNYYGFRLNLPPGESYSNASPAAMGALTYIAFETRRLHDAVKPKGEKFVPLEVMTLWQPLDLTEAALRSRSHTKQGLAAHSSGDVFDISLANLPSGERQCLQFILDDIGWDGYLGFVQDVPDSNVMHIGPSPSSRDFFTTIAEEARIVKD